MIYSITRAGKHGHIGFITNEKFPILRIKNTNSYIYLPTGEIRSYTIHNERSDSSLYRAMRRFLDLINTNITSTSKLITLTTQANMQDREKCLEWIRLFCKTKEFRECFGTSYLYTVENQERGALHLHIICFKPLKKFISWHDLRFVWCSIIGGDGSVKEKPIDDPEHIGIYLVKDFLNVFASVPKGKRLFVPSRSLKRPIKGKLNDAEHRELPEKFKKNKIKAYINGEERTVGSWW